MTTYQNTPENAKSVGWDRLPEYCCGESDSKFITHDTIAGLFFFHDDAQLCPHCQKPLDDEDLCPDDMCDFWAPLGCPTGPGA